MTKEQQLTLDKAVELISQDIRVDGIILGGSIAHGFSTPISDVDIMITISEDERKELSETIGVSYYNGDIACYEGGYVDGKYLSREFIKQVAIKGSEPARFAFCDAVVVYDKLGGLEDLVKQAGCYQDDDNAQKIKRFLAQVEGWSWYYEQGCEKDSDYLRGIGTYKAVMFAGRLLLAVNKVLYPYHKWMFRAMKECKIKPDGYVELVEKITKKATTEDMKRLLVMCRELAGDNAADGWCGEFVRDVELTWLTGEACVDEI